VPIQIALEKDADAFLAHVRKAFPNVSHTPLEKSLRRLIDWSVACRPVVEHAVPDGSDPKLGASGGPFGLMVWRVFPRKEDGAKVALMPGSGRKIDDSLHELIADILNGLRLNEPIRPRQALEVGLDAISSDVQWRRFKAALQCAYDATVVSS
jgi:hypothetical protein